MPGPLGIDTTTSPLFGGRANVPFPALCEGGTPVRIQLLWTSVRRTGSTLGRLRKLAVNRTREVNVRVPEVSRAERIHRSMTHWSQLIA